MARIDRPASEAGTAGRLARLGGHPAGPVALYLAAVAEGCLFPAPTEALLAALALARPRRAVWMALVATAGSVTGGLLAYLFGAHWYPTMAAPLLERWGAEAAAQRLGTAYRENVAAALLTSGFTPVPYLMYGLIAGAMHVPLPAFLLFSLLGRLVKYAVLGGAVGWAAPHVRRLWRRHGRRAPLLLAVLAFLALLWALTRLA